MLESSPAKNTRKTYLLCKTWELDKSCVLIFTIIVFNLINLISKFHSTLYTYILSIWSFHVIMLYSLIRNNSSPAKSNARSVNTLCLLLVTWFDTVAMARFFQKEPITIATTTIKNGSLPFIVQWQYKSGQLLILPAKTTTLQWPKGNLILAL